MAEIVKEELNIEERVRIYILSRSDGVIWRKYGSRIRTRDEESE